MALPIDLEVPRVPTTTRNVMPCYHPLRAWRTDDNEIVFAERGRIHSQITLACGQCIGCRLERSRQWAIRCMHESKMHRQNAFITLTYDDQHLPPGGTLHYRDFQLFMKRLRRSAGDPSTELIVDFVDSTPQIRFYMAGEYGELNHRPHYHACLFGIDFNDKKYIARTPTGSKLYESTTLQQLWQQGFSSIGEVTFESAAYVARYIMKKITGQQQKTHYEKIDQNTGELIQLKPEFNNMSRAQGIGKAWLEKYQADVYPHAKVIVRGKKSNPPRYYDKQYKNLQPLEWEPIEYDRYLEGKKHTDDQLEHRLKARETVAAAKISLLKRKI